MSLLITTVRELMLRDLSKLRKEIESYPSNDLLWVIKGDVKNPAGNLCLHLCGNLQHYISAVLGKSGYVRNRDEEFSTRGLTKVTLLKEIDATINIVLETLEKLDSLIVEQQYPENVFDRPMTTGHFLIHLAGHLNYHLGQINYHRRFVV